MGRAATVVLDGTFGSPAARELAESLARRAGAEMLVIKCECPKAEVLARIRQRLQRGDDLSEARPDLYDNQAAEDSLGSANRVFCVDTTLGLTDQLNNVRVRLNRALFVD
jgi:predicted kinase